jgi:hypothetical protein
MSVKDKPGRVQVATINSQDYGLHTKRLLAASATGFVARRGVAIKTDFFSLTSLLGLLGVDQSFFDIPGVK